MSKERVLHEAIALRQGEVGRNKSLLTRAYKANQKPALFNGFTKNYEPVDAEGQKLPPESAAVQMTVDEQLKEVTESLNALWDTVAAVEYANTEAKADVIVNGETILSDVPATYLLFLEKQLTDVKTYVSSLPTLSSDTTWTRDENDNLFKSPVTQRHRNEKKQKPIVLYDATDEHPAQTQLVTVDELAGYWNEVKHSGAIPATRKAVLLARVENLLASVKTARARANTVTAPDINVGKSLLNFIFA